MSKGKAWTPDEIETVKLMAARGADDKTIAAHLGRSVEGIRKVRQREGIKRGEKTAPRAKWTEAEDRALIEGFAARLSAEQIARKLGRSKAAVWHRSAALGGAATKAASVPQEAEQIALDVDAAELPRVQAQVVQLAEALVAAQAAVDQMRSEITAMKKQIFSLEGWAGKPALFRGAYERR